MARQLRTGADVNNQKIINLASPSADTDAANKAYVDNVAAGFDFKQSARAATTANITLSATQTVDGVSLAVGDRVLVKNQTTASANGIYVVASGAWARASDGGQGALSSGATIAVEEGSVNADTMWVLVTDGAINVGTTSLVWSQFKAGITYTAGNGLTLTGNQFAVNAGSGLIVDGTSLRLDPNYAGFAKKFAAAVPAGATSTVITHGLGTADVTVNVYDITGSSPVLVDVDITNVTTTQLTVVTASAVTASQYRIVITG